MKVFTGDAPARPAPRPTGIRPVFVVLLLLFVVLPVLATLLVRPERRLVLEPQPTPRPTRVWSYAAPKPTEPLPAAPQEAALPLPPEAPPAAAPLEPGASRPVSEWQHYRPAPVVRRTPSVGRLDPSAAANRFLDSQQQPGGLSPGWGADAQAGCAFEIDRRGVPHCRCGNRWRDKEYCTPR